jgi:hypothetical protein
VPRRGAAPAAAARTGDHAAGRAGDAAAAQSEDAVKRPLVPAHASTKEERAQLRRATLKWLAIGVVANLIGGGVRYVGAPRLGGSPPSPRRSFGEVRELHRIELSDGSLKPTGT